MTSIRVRVPDVAWASPEFMKLHGDNLLFPRAPDICVEVISLSNTEAENTEKTRAYLQAGAREVWIASEAGELHVFDSTDERGASRFSVTLNLPKLSG